MQIATKLLIAGKLRVGQKIYTLGRVWHVSYLEHSPDRQYVQIFLVDGNYFTTSMWKHVLNKIAVVV